MAYDKEEKDKKIYEPTEKEEEIIASVYKDYDWMWENVMNQKYPEMNDRTPKQFWDDSQKRANSYVPSRESQGKDEWQANVFTGTTRDKLRAMVSATSKEPPQMRMSAYDDKRQESYQRAEVMKNLVRHSYTTYDNPEEVIFFDGWDCGVNGTVIKYDTYLYSKGKTKIVTNYDPTTGECEYEEEEVVFEDRPAEFYVDPNRLFIWNPYIRDIQRQPKLIWVDYMDESAFDAEFGGFKNADKVSLKRTDTRNDSDLFMGQKWWDRTNEKKIEVLRKYDKQNDQYCVIANGVLILDAPMLWGRKRKIFPFAKTIFEPWANSSLFWGNALPNILMPHQDTENSLWNSSLDKTFRTTQTPLLVGMVNKDQLDLEDEWVSGDTRIYVQDVSQVTPMPIPQVNASEFNMLNMVAQKLSAASVDALQQGQGGSGSTAREMVLANERAQEIKGLFYLMLKDLWLQKYRLRTQSLLLNWNRPIKLEQVGGKEAVEVFREFNIANTELSNGQKGTLNIKLSSQEEIAKGNEIAGYREDGKPFNRIDVEEEKIRVEEGRNVEILLVPYDYLDEWMFDMEIMTESLYQKGKSLDMAMATEKTQAIAQLFPEIFAANKEKFFSEMIRQYNDNPDKYLEATQRPVAMPDNPQEALMAAMQGAQGQPAPEQGNGGGPVTAQLTAPAKSLPQLVGAG